MKRLILLLSLISIALGVNAKHRTLVTLHLIIHVSQGEEYEEDPHYINESNIMNTFLGRPSENNCSDTETAVYDLLDSLGIEYVTLCHKAAYTMEECAEVEKTLGAPICKNLFLCNRQQTQFYLLMLPGDKVFKTKFLSSQLGCARLSFAGEEHMVELLHIHPGAVSPMGLMNDTEHLRACSPEHQQERKFRSAPEHLLERKKVLLVIDKDLLDSEYFGCHPCVNTATIKLRIKDLIEKFLPKVGHEYRIVEL